jgi:LiaI-LiaF-like transmembrane region
MDANRRGGLVGGLLLILLGGAFLAAQLIPGSRSWFNAEDSWPLIVIGIGVLLVVLAIALRTSPLAIPGCIVAGIGCMLYYQNATGNWGSWAYAWTLIPAFVGLGVLVSGLLEGQPMRSLTTGVWMILISLVAFVIFGSFLGMGRFSAYWPLLLVLGGLLILGQAILGRRR